MAPIPTGTHPPPRTHSATPHTPTQHPSPGHQSRHILPAPHLTAPGARDPRHAGRARRRSRDANPRGGRRSLSPRESRASILTICLFMPLTPGCLSSHAPISVSALRYSYKGPTPRSPNPRAVPPRPMHTIQAPARCPSTSHPRRRPAGLRDATPQIRPQQQPSTRRTTIRHPHNRQRQSPSPSPPPTPAHHTCPSFPGPPSQNKTTPNTTNSPDVAAPGPRPISPPRPPHLAAPRMPLGGGPRLPTPGPSPPTAAFSPPPDPPAAALPHSAPSLPRPSTPSALPPASPPSHQQDRLLQRPYQAIMTTGKATPPAPKASPQPPATGCELWLASAR